jgi:hypothetical protein
MKKVLKIIIIFLVLTSCQSTRDAFSLKKKNSADEFLVEKKSPLVLPPEYGKLPLPKDIENNDNQLNSERDVKNLIINDKKASSTKVKKSTKPTSIEKSILRKIK